MTIGSNNDFILCKLERLKRKEKLRVLDIFSGCGGLSLGFQKAGSEIIGNIELDPDAALTHALNFHKDHPNFSEFSKPRDIQKITPQNLFKELGYTENPQELVDVIVGGPPCQAFTRIGRAKLRETFNDSKAFLKDQRSQLYKSYLEYVKELKPLAVLMENVPDMLNYGGINIADLACNDLNSFGYNCNYTILNTAHFGLPQMRERVFIIAIHKEAKSKIHFPTPTHHLELPKGYHGSRSVALKLIKCQSENKYFIKCIEPANDSSIALSAKDALSDLPKITSHLKSNPKSNTRKLDVNVAYEIPTGENDFQILMRTWPGFETNGSVTANVIRYLPRDYPIFKKMKAGDQYPQALKIANSIFTNKLYREKIASGITLSARTKKYKIIKQETIPPYDAKKFPNKWRKMEDDKPARTLMAHLGKDSYSHIHYDSDQARTISVREAARLQSFPDGFHFCGAMNSAFRQIGNAVPPLLAEHLAITIKKILLKE